MDDLSLHDQSSHRSARAAGIALLRWQSNKAALRLCLYAIGGIGPVVTAAYLFVSFMFPGGAIFAWIGAAGFIVYELFAAWEPIYKDVGQFLLRREEIRIVAAILPAVATYREGRNISGADRYKLSQLRIVIGPQVERFRKEAEEWRVKGWSGRATGLGALIYDLEDAQKALNLSYAQAEQEMRPRQVEPVVAITPAPVDKPVFNAERSVLERYRKTGLVSRRAKDDVGRTGNL